MDGVSSASGVIAVVTVAVQLAQGVKKLVEFGKRVQDAPAEVSALFQDLEILSSVLAKTRLLGDLVALDDVGELVLSNCDSKISRLQAKLQPAIEQFEPDRRWTRTWASLKISLKDKQIGILQKSILEAKSTLHVMQQNSIVELLALSRQDQQKFQADLSSIKHSVQQNSRQTTVIFKIQPNSSSPVQPIAQVPAATVSDSRNDHEMKSKPSKFLTLEPKGELGSLSTRDPSSSTQLFLTRESSVVESWEIKTGIPFMIFHGHGRSKKVKTGGTSKANESMEKEASYVLYPTKWLQMLGFSHGAQINATSTRGWKYSLEPFRAVPEDSLIFEFCRSGNLGGVRTLLKRGDASPWDRDPSGRTPLWVAAKSLSLPVTKLLLQEGADIHARDWRQELEPISTIIDSSPIDVSLKQSMIHLLRSQSHDGYEDDILSNLIGRGFMAYRVQKQIDISWLRKQEAVLQLISEVVPSVHSSHPLLTKALHCAVDFYYERGVLRYLLQSMEGGIYQDEPQLSVVHEAITKRLPERDRESMRLIMQKTGNLYWCVQHQIPSTQANTPTMLAMYDASLFSIWRDLLREIGADTGKFVMRELEDGLLGEAGWDRDTLKTLFDRDYDWFPKLEERNKVFGFPRCERCGDGGTQIGARLKVDLEWRRILRFIRLRQPFNTNSYKLAVPESQTRGFPCTSTDLLSISAIAGAHLDPTESQKSSLDTLSENPGSMKLPYRIVCSTKCQDEICAAWIYENDCLDEPEFPALNVEDEAPTVPILVAQSMTDDGDECPTTKMPGAFRD